MAYVSERGGVGSPDRMQSSPAGSRTGAGRRGRGFASMDRERQREIASKGGKAAHRKGTAHQWTADEAREAGKKGGTIVSRDREHMAMIGRAGGAASQRKLGNNSDDNNSNSRDESR
jgi:general stress protein YciG